MSQLDELTRLMTALGKLGDLETVCSPGHPAGARLVREVEDFLNQYVFLRNDAGYVAFLQRYAGAGFKSHDDMLSLDLFGFSEDVTLHILRGEGDVIENGLLTFADLLIPLEPGRGVFVNTKGCGFGFPATPQRQWGVYQISEGRSCRYCDSFLEWLAQFVDKKGRLLD